MEKRNPAIHILLADDEARCLQGMSLVLRRAGYRVTTVGCAEEILALRRRLSGIHLALVDLELPGLWTNALCELFAGRSDLPGVLAMSGFPDIKRVEAAMKAGCIGYLEKPFEAEALLESVAWAIRKTTQKRREDQMNKLNVVTGLCSTCNLAPECGYLARAGQPVLQCEEFDGFQSVPARPAALGDQPAAAAEVATGRFQGLCMDCDWRESCLEARRSQAVWHCENYR